MNLENIIANRARDGKTVVLVGCFLETIYRAFLGTIFGKYFENVAIFTIYEEITTLKKYQESREEDFGNPGGKVLQDIAIYGRVFPLYYKIITKIKENRLRKPKN